MTPETTEAEMAQARAQLTKLGRHPRGRNRLSTTQENSSVRGHRRLLALCARKLNREAQQVRCNA
jgi:hypothetical protein